MSDTLANLRRAIDAIDEQLIVLLADRTALARSVARLKREQGMPIVDPEREAHVIERVAGLARRHGLNEGEVRALYWRLLALSRREQIEAAGDPGQLPSN
jgi:chorismate mutase